MQVWRLTKPLYAPGLDGLGAKRYGGRWNSVGRAVVYCSTSLALSCLEAFVHVPPSMRSSDKMPPQTAVRLRLPDGLAMETVAWADLPDAPRIEDYREIGDAWIDRGETLALVVPSLVIPPERNVLLNPAHPAMRDVVLEAQEPFRFDRRLSAPEA